MQGYKETLVDVATIAAVKAAREWCETTGHKFDVSDEAFCECLKSWLKIQLPIALKDAKDAVDAGMYDVANQTFIASMAIAGIEAAKESCRMPE